MTQWRPSRTARVRMAATSEPASDSLIPMHHAEAPDTMSGRKRRRCSGVPNCRRVGPIWRSANHEVATGAPPAMSASNTTKRSRGERPPPPSSTGQVMPSQPRSASSRENAREVPMSQESSGTSTRGRQRAASSRASACSSSSGGASSKSISRRAPSPA